MGPSGQSPRPPPPRPPLQRSAISAAAAKWLLQDALHSSVPRPPTAPRQPDKSAPSAPSLPALPALPSLPSAAAHPRHTGATTAWIPPEAEELEGLLEDYQFIGMIGRGGMGAVYLGMDSRLDRPVAIKILPPELSRLPGFAGRFRREAWALAQLEHPHIVSIHQSGATSAGHLYFVMEYLGGSNLAECLEQRRAENNGPPFPQEKVLEIACQVCEALEGAHDRGILHRDIKPANLLMDESGHVKLVDFGLARPLDVSGPETHLTATHQLMGTRDYMAPELLAGREIDARVDVYATGVLLYEMLTGEVPRGVFLPPSKKQAVDPRLDGIVATAMQSDPEHRYANIAELHSALDALRHSGCSDGKPRGDATLAVMTLALFAGLSLLLWDANRRNRIHSGATPPAPTAVAGDTVSYQNPGTTSPEAPVPGGPAEVADPDAKPRAGLIFSTSFDVPDSDSDNGKTALGLPGFSTEAPYTAQGKILAEGLSYQDSDGVKLESKGGAALLDSAAQGGTISLVSPLSLADGPEPELWISFLARQTAGTNARFINLCLRGKDDSNQPPDSDRSLDEVLAIGMRSRIGPQVWQVWDRSTFGTLSKAAETTAPTTLTTFLLVRWQRNAESVHEKTTLWINPPLSRDPVESEGVSFVSAASDLDQWSQLQHLRLGAGHGGPASPESSSAWIIDEIRLGWTRAAVTPH
ncbi:MAG: pknB 20 [Verrucomicrobiales bacterium]|nr:pknB 20 [Verrucomicrobiales bacterium]